MEERTQQQGNENRRDALKHAGMFVIPTVTALTLAEISVAASGGGGFTDWADKPSVD